MKNLNTKTKFLFDVKMNLMGKSASEKLDCIKKIQRIIEDEDGRVFEFQSLPFSKGGKYKLHTSTLTNTRTFEVVDNVVSVFDSSRSANLPPFSIEVFSDLFIKNKIEELQNAVFQKQSELDLYLKTKCAKEYCAKIKKNKDEIILRKNKEIDKQKETGYITTISFFKDNILSNIKTKEIDFSKVAKEKSDIHKYILNHFIDSLKDLNIVLSKDIFWDCFKEYKRIVKHNIYNYGK
jgi:hypothetical protein